jgi:hypothetical protein
MTDEEIRELFRSPKTGLIGLASFATKNNLSYNRVVKALKGEDVYTLNAPAVGKFEHRRTIVGGIDDQWQADLLDMAGQVDDNDNYRYILCVIDCFSKYGWVEPLKNKNAKEVTAGFEKILLGGRKPKKLQTDDGTEFWNSTMKKLLEKEGIGHFSTQSPVKASIVERWNRTIRMRLTRLWDATGSFNWIDKIQEIIQSYNETSHTSIGMTPIDASKPENEQTVRARLYPPPLIVPIVKPLEVGQHVRIATARGIFTKEQVNKWSREIFVISKILNTIPWTYQLKDLAEEPVLGGWYRQELQPVDKPEKFGITVLKERKYRGKKQLFVHYIGYPSSMDEWIDANNVV